MKLLKEEAETKKNASPENPAVKVDNIPVAKEEQSKPAASEDMKFEEEPA